MPHRVLVIGLDGGTFDVMRPLAEGGLMPTFAGLMAAGRPGTLRSTVPWYTIPGWASLMTGVDPMTHGLLHWVVAPEGEYFEDRRRGRRFVTSGDLGSPTFWDVASAAGRKVAVLNMPLTYPAWPVNGTMITGLLTPKAAEEGTCYPPDLLQRFPGYQVDLSISREADSPDAPPLRGVDLPAYLRELVELTDGRARVGAELLRDEVDLGVVVFVGPDRISHKAWPEQAAVVEGRDAGETGQLIEDYYRSLDRAVASLLEAAGPETTVMVVSDHGFGPPPERTFEVNAWLREAGYLRVPMGSAQRVAASNPRAVRRLLRPLARRLRRRYQVPGEAGLVDWSRSTAYAVFYPHTRVCGIMVNAAGRKRAGSVPPHEVPTVLRRVEEELRSARDPEGRPVVREVHRVEAEGPGLPDLLVEVTEPFVPGDGLLRPDVFGSWEQRSGLHEQPGAFLLAGPGVRGTGQAHADIVDVAPSVLSLLGIAPPDHMAGRVLDDLLVAPPSLQPPPPVGPPGGGGPAISGDEEREIEEHLQALGYVE